MFGAYPAVPARRPIGRQQAVSPKDVAWKLTWPSLVSSIIAGVMILCLMVIGALEIASLAKYTGTALGNTSSTGAGLWCSFFFLIAALLILMIQVQRQTYRWALIALIATVVAACFAIILIGLDAKAVKDGNDIKDALLLDSLPDKSKVLAAQLAFAILEFLLCLAFIGIYIAVSIIAPRRLRRAPRQVPLPPGYPRY